MKEIHSPVLGVLHGKAPKSYHLLSRPTSVQVSLAGRECTWRENHAGSTVVAIAGTSDTGLSVVATSLFARLGNMIQTWSHLCPSPGVTEESYCSSEPWKLPFTHLFSMHTVCACVCMCVHVCVLCDGEEREHAHVC